MTRVSQLKHHGLFQSNVPRYTSYPPANHFGGGVTQDEHRNWISQIPSDRPVSIYVHIPFCRRLCWFCACRTQGVRTQAPVEAYVNTLVQEIQQLSRILPHGVKAERIHWGGGTPTLLNADQIAMLAGALADAVPLTESGEFSVEVDPNEIGEARLDALADAGMSRASIGVQDFDPEIQTVIGRQQSYDITRTAADGLRSRGIHSLNTDLLYGLPKQTRSRIASSIQMLLSLNPDRIALYGYAHVPWMAKRQSLIPTDDLPSPEARLALFETAQKLLTWDGYEQIGIDHFARPDDRLAKAAASGHLRRNFQGYTDDTAPVLIGLGASSISKFPQGYVQNASATAAYQSAVRLGELPTGRSHRLTGEDRLRARMIEMIMCDFRIDIGTLVSEGLGTEARISGLLTEVAKTFEDLVQNGADGLTISREAHPLARIVAREVDAYDRREAGHSSAI